MAVARLPSRLRSLPLHSRPVVRPNMGGTCRAPSLEQDRSAASRAVFARPGAPHDAPAICAGRSLLARTIAHSMRGRVRRRVDLALKIGDGAILAALVAMPVRNQRVEHSIILWRREIFVVVHRRAVFDANG